MKPPGLLDMFSPDVVINTLLLAGVLGAGTALIVAVRRRLRPSPRVAEAGRSGRMGDAGFAGRIGESGWETTIANYKNLRDEGVLSEEEFRKIRTLVEPRTRIGMPELRPRHRPPTDPTGPAKTRE